MKQKQSRGLISRTLMVVGICALLLMIAIPIALKVLSDSSTKAYEKQVKMIEKAARTYVTKHKDQLIFDQTGVTVITLKQLQDDGFLDSSLIDARDKKPMTCADIQVTKQTENTFDYTIDTEACLSK